MAVSRSLLFRSSGLFVLLGCLFLISQSVHARPDGDAGWRAFVDRFVQPDGRIVDSGNNNVSHTEGQGWGMLMAVAFNDPERFERIWGWTRDNLRRERDGLYAWRYLPGADEPIPDTNNASDGDVLIAWALDRAWQRWGRVEHRSESRRLRYVITRHLIREYAGYTVLLPARYGFEHRGYINLNLSYWVMPAFARFAELEPEGPWRALMRDGERLLKAGRFGEQDLPPDWLRLGQDGSLGLAEQWPPRFGFEAVRIPLYFVWAGRPDADGLSSVATFWARPNPPAWLNLVDGESADYRLSGGGTAISYLLRGEPEKVPRAPTADDDYYSASLLMLARLALRDSQAPLNPMEPSGR